MTLAGERLQDRVGSDCVLQVAAIKRGLVLTTHVAEVVGVGAVGEHVRDAEFLSALGVRIAGHHDNYTTSAEIVSPWAPTPHALNLALGVTERNEFLQELRITMLDVIQINHHVVAHLQREIELGDLLARASIGSILGIKRGHLVTQSRSVNLHEDEPQPVGEVLHQCRLAVTGRRHQQQQAHEVGALSLASGADLLGEIVAHQRQVHLIDQLAAYK